MTIQPTRPQTGILVSTDLAAGAADDGYQSQQHAEGIVVSTGLLAGAADEGYESQQHAEGIVVCTHLRTAVMGAASAR